MQSLVLDTNVVLDLFVFDDESARPLRRALEEGALHWLATAAMRDELVRVLDYPNIARKLSDRMLTAVSVLEAFERLACTVEVPQRAPAACKDRDDQKFIDLAVARKAVLVSKDRQVLVMKKRLAALDVRTCCVSEM